MGKESNKKKSKQLGMNHATAAGRLRKMIMFQMMQELGKDSCHQCGEKIESIKDLSVEHKIPWLDSDDPVRLYFDLDNITFSHLKCNSGSRRAEKSRHGTFRRYSKHGCRCFECTKANREKKRKQRNKPL